MAGLAQTTINRIKRSYMSVGYLALPAEVNARNVLIFCVLALLCIGSIMVASASMPYAERIHENPFHYITRHGISIVAAAVAAYVAYKVPLNVWFNNTFSFWIINHRTAGGSFGQSVREVNGSKRWIRIAGFTLQASEVAKVMMAIFTADYVVRRCRRSA